tara:strand:- start:621 stop:899 length:279 start_codon:yes stop_codon:yes gene_type:complete
MTKNENDVDYESFPFGKEIKNIPCPNHGFNQKNSQKLMDTGSVVFVKSASLAQSLIARQKTIYRRKHKKYPDNRSFSQRKLSDTRYGVWRLK